MISSQSLSDELIQVVKHCLSQQEQQEEWCKPLVAAIKQNKLYILIEEVVSVQDLKAGAQGNLWSQSIAHPAVILSAGEGSKPSSRAGTSATIVWIATAVNVNNTVSGQGDFRNCPKKCSLLLEGHGRQHFLTQLAYSMLYRASKPEPPSVQPGTDLLLFRKNLRKSIRGVLAVNYLNATRHQIGVFTTPIKFSSLTIAPNGPIDSSGQIVNSRTRAFANWVESQHPSLGFDKQENAIKLLTGALSSGNLFICGDGRPIAMNQSYYKKPNIVRDRVVIFRRSNDCWGAYVAELLGPKMGERQLCIKDFRYDPAGDRKVFKTKAQREAEQCMLFSIMRVLLWDRTTSKYSPILLSEKMTESDAQTRARTGLMTELCTESENGTLGNTQSHIPEASASLAGNAAKRPLSISPPRGGSGARDTSNLLLQGADTGLRGRSPAKRQILPFSGGWTSFVDTAEGQARSGGDSLSRLGDGDTFMGSSASRNGSPAPF